MLKASPDTRFTLSARLVIIGFALLLLIPVGVSTAPSQVSLTPSSKNFGNVAVSELSTSQAFTLKNNQTGALAISSIATTGDFTQTNNCPPSLPAKPPARPDWQL